MQEGKDFKEDSFTKFMNKKGDSFNVSILKMFLFVVAFILGGTGLTILFNAKGDAGSLVSGFALIGIAIAIIYKMLEK